MVLVRFHHRDTGAAVRPSQFMLSEVRRVQDGHAVTFRGAAPTTATGAAGWLVQALPAGTWFMQVGGLFGPKTDAENRQHDFTFVVPPGGGVAYIGSLALECREGVQASCRLAAPPAEEPPDARPGIDASGPHRTSMVRPFDLVDVRSGWPSPARFEAGIDQTAWQAAINWEDFASRAGSRGTLGAAGAAAGIGVRILDASSGNDAGMAVLALPFFAVALGALAASGVVAVAEDVHRGQVQQQWGQCLASLAAQAEAGALQRAVSQSLSTAPLSLTGHRAAVSAMPWEVRLTRVVLRPCGQPGNYAVEVGTAWSAAAREARFVRPVEGAARTPGSIWPWPAPWEAQAGGTATCRPLAAYCAAYSADIVAREVTEAVTGGRDLLLQSR